MSGPAGFALRHNGSCPASEVDCGKTVPPYHVCCPAASFCPRAYNVDCCPTSANCTETLLKKPSCANESWDLYDNGGYFCCEKGFTGYQNSLDGSDGCAEPGYAFMKGQVLLPILSSGQVSATAASSTSASSIPSSTSGSPPSSSTTPPADASQNAPKSHTGAIVGGVVGGIGGVILVALAFWMWRRRRSGHSAAGTTNHPELPVEDVALGKYSIAVPLRSELEGQNGRSEVSAEQEPGQLAAHHGLSELPGS